MSTKDALKYKTARDTVLRAAFALDDLPDDPGTWTHDERLTAARAIMSLGAPESKLRRMVPADLKAAVKG